MSCAKHRPIALSRSDAARGRSPARHAPLASRVPAQCTHVEGQLGLADRGWRVLAPQLRGFDDGAGDLPATSMDDYAAT